MRFDLEQFLALTMALGTAGALGVAVYTSHTTPAEAHPSEGVEAVEDEPFPEAEDDPPAPAPVAPAPATTPTPAPVAPMPALDAAPEELEAAPGPQVESMMW